MVTKKQQDLIIQNLKSILAEVRLKSLRQLEQIMSIPQDEKIGYYKIALEDSDETIRTQARRLLTNAGVEIEAKPVAPAAPPQMPETSPTAPDEVAPEATPELPSIEPPPPPPEPPAAPPPAPKQPPEPSLPPLDFGNLGAPVPPGPKATPKAPPSVPKPTPPGYPLPEPISLAPEPPRPPEPRSKPAGSIKIEAPPLDDIMDPGLPDVSTYRSVPDLLEHIRNLAKKRPSGHLAQLLELAQHNQEEISLTALQTLLNLKDPRTPAQVLPMLTLPGFSSQRRFLILKIIMETRSEIDPVMLEQVLINEKDVIVKSGLVKVFARISRGQGLETLIACLADPDPRVRANTVEVIEEQQIRGCESQISALLKDPENRVKVNAAKFLVKCGFSEAFTTLRSMLGSPEVWLRDSVIFALGEIGDQASLVLLKAALKDPSQGIRLSVLKALAKINTMPSREVLQSAINDPDSVVAQVARGLWEKIKDTPARPTVSTTVQPPPEGARPPSPQTPPAPVPPAAPPVPPPPQATPRTAPAVPHSSPVPPTAPPRPTIPSTGPTAPQRPPVPPPLPPSRPTAGPPRPGVPPAASQPLSPAAPRPMPPVPPRVPIAPGVPGAKAPPPAPPASAGPRKSFLPPGEPKFQKPRSGEIFNRLDSTSPEDVQAAIKDLPFVMGEDQNILIAKAMENANDAVRLTAAKVLSRKRGPVFVEMMKALAADPSPLVREFAAKALTMMK